MRKTRLEDYKTTRTYQKRPYSLEDELDSPSSISMRWWLARLDIVQRDHDDMSYLNDMIYQLNDIALLDL